MLRGRYPVPFPFGQRKSDLSCRQRLSPESHHRLLGVPVANDVASGRTTLTSPELSE